MISHILDLSRLENQPALVKNPCLCLDLLTDKMTGLPEAKSGAWACFRSFHRWGLLDCCWWASASPSLDNLISNALKFTKDRIELSLRKLDGICQRTVTDNGAGIVRLRQIKSGIGFTKSIKPEIKQSRGKRPRTSLGPKNRRFARSR